MAFVLRMVKLYLSGFGRCPLKSRRRLSVLSLLEHYTYLCVQYLGSRYGNERVIGLDIRVVGAFLVDDGLLVRPRVI